jgi:polysaccharide biosynthesis transport protein
MMPPEPRLIDYLRIVARRWVLILGVTLSAGILALLVGRTMPKEYRSSATVVIVPPRAGATVPTGTYRGLLQNPSLTAQALSELGLDRPPHSIDPQTFLGKSVEIEEVPATNLLIVHVQMQDAALAARIANQIVAAAVKLNQRLTQDAATAVSNDLQSQVAQARSKFDEAQKRFLDFKSSAQVDLRKREADALLTARQGLLPLMVEIAAEKARDMQLEKELAGLQRVLDVRRVGSDKGALLSSVVEEARRTQFRDDPTVPDSVANSIQVSTLPDQRSELLNPVYEALEFQLAAGRVRLATLESRRDELMVKRKLDGAQLEQLSALYDRETQQARLDLERDLAQRTYLDLAGRYEQARAQVATDTNQLQTVGLAVPATRPASPRIVMMVVVAVLVAFMASLLGAFLIEYVSTVGLAEQDSTPKAV